QNSIEKSFVEKAIDDYKYTKSVELREEKEQKFLEKTQYLYKSSHLKDLTLKEFNTTLLMIRGMNSDLWYGNSEFKDYIVYVDTEIFKKLVLGEIDKHDINLTNDSYYLNLITEYRKHKDTYLLNRIKVTDIKENEYSITFYYKDIFYYINKEDKTIKIKNNTFFGFGF
ncbi:MAG: hypothetical protein HN833_00800, partial [Elusimicrobiaceae bacterium]|nr:hypothetical protein [Elusimicrobiaceae bacterium]